MPIHHDYDTIQGMTLDQILFDTPEPYRELLLRQVLNTETPIKLKATGPVPVRLKGWDQDFEADEEKSFVPRMAILLLDLYGREGAYHGVHQATGLKPTSYNQLPAERRELLGPITFITAHLTHAEPF